jgi:hypothetical protein
MFHSGSVRYYGGRMTLRYDMLDQAWLDRSLAWLEQHGAHPYLLVSDWEIPQFLGRFERQEAAGQLARPPVFRYQGQAGEIFLFDLAPKLPPRSEAATVMVADEIDDLRSAPPVAPPALVLREFEVQGPGSRVQGP